MVQKALFSLIFLFLPLPLYAASLEILIPRGSYPNDSVLVADILVSSEEQKINAVALDINFPADKLSIVSLSTEDSILDTWPRKPIFSNEYGTINMEGVMIGDEWSGNNGKVAEIIFKVKAAGEAEIRVVSGSVLASDGEGTNILNSLTNSAVVLGTNDSTRYLLVKAEELSDLADMPTKPKSISEISDEPTESMTKTTGDRFDNDLINAAYAILAVLLIILARIWWFLGKIAKRNIQ